MAIEDSGFGIQKIELKDNSIRQITSTSSLGLISSIHPVFSSDGKDNIITEPQSFNEVLSKYGDDFTDINKFGLQNLLVQQVFDGGGKAYVCRLLPDDASTAHFVVKIGVKKADSIQLYQRDDYGRFKLNEDGEKIKLQVEQSTPNPGQSPDPIISMIDAKTTGLSFKIMVEYATPDDIRNAEGKPNRLSNMLKKIPKNPTSDGYKVFPLFFAHYYANGNAGNKYGAKILNDLMRDEKVNDGRRYRLFLVKKTNIGAETLSYGNDLSFSFNPNATISKTIPAIEGLQKIYQNYEGIIEKPVQLNYFVENYEEFARYVTSLLAEEITTTPGLPSDFELNTPKSLNELDFLFGKDKEGNSYDTIVFDENSANLSNPFYFDKGSDGKFETLTGEELQTAREIELKKFFNCLVDTKTITNVLKCDAGIMFDSNYSMEIKKSMLSMLQNRRDINVIFDCGFTENLNEACAVAKAIRSWIGSSEGGENYCIVPHCGVTVDRIVNVRTTATYEFAYGLMRLYSRSPFSLYASKPDDNGCVRRMIFDWIVEETIPKGQEIKLAKQHRLYYAIDLGKAVSSFATDNYTGRNVYFFSNANLYNEPISKLAEFRNSMLINDLRRVLKLVLVKYTFDTSGAESAIKKATEELQTILTKRYPANVLINYNLHQTDRDKLLNQASCELTVFFPDVFETWSCTIISDRASDPAAAA